MYTEKDRERARRYYLANKEKFLQKSKERSEREKQDRLLAKQGDTEAAARAEKVREQWRKREGHIPMQKHREIQAAVKEVLKPLRDKARQRRNLLENKRNREKEAQLRKKAKHGDEQAAAVVSHLRENAYNRQQRWKASMEQKAEAGDLFAMLCLWKKTKPGMKWRAAQLSAGKSTGLDALPEYMQQELVLWHLSYGVPKPPKPAKERPPLKKGESAYYQLPEEERKQKKAYQRARYQRLKAEKKITT